MYSEGTARICGPHLRTVTRISLRDFFSRMLFRCVFLAILLKCTEHASCHEKRASLPSAFVGTWLLSSNQQEMLIRKQTATQMRFRPSVAAPKMQIRNTFNDNSDKPLVL